jgi:hypothetical protein
MKDSSSLRRVFRSALLAVLVLSGASCAASGALDATAQVRAELRSQGFDDAGVHVGSLSGVRSEDVVTVVLVDDEIDPVIAREAAAGAVWDALPVSFDRLIVEYQSESVNATYAELEESLGPRSASVEEQSVDDLISSGVRMIALGSGVILLVLVGVIVLVVMAVRRRTRRSSRSPK